MRPFATLLALAVVAGALSAQTSDFVAVAKEARPISGGASQVASMAPVHWLGEQDVLAAIPRAEGGRSVVDLYTADGKVAFSTGTSKPDLTTSWHDAENTTIVHTVTTDCDNYSGPEECVRAHQRYVSAMKEAYPPAPDGGQ